MTAESTYMIHGRTIRCAADQAIKPYVDAFAEVLAGYPSDYFHDGAVLRVGWSTYQLAFEGQEIIVSRPDFLGDIGQWVRDLSLALSIEAQQRHVLRLAGLAEGASVLFNEKVIYLDGTLDAPEVVAQRTQPGEGADSGWYFAIPGEEPVPDRLRATNAYKLLRTRPALLNVLALPLGYLAALSGDQIELILNGEDEPVFDRKEVDGGA